MIHRSTSASLQMVDGSDDVFAAAQAINTIVHLLKLIFSQGKQFLSINLISCEHGFKTLIDFVQPALLEP